MQLLELIPTPLLSRKITKPNLLSILETRSNQSLTTSQRQRLFTYLQGLNPQGLKSCQIKYRNLTDDIPDIEMLGKVALPVFAISRNAVFRGNPFSSHILSLLTYIFPCLTNELFDVYFFLM